MPDFILEVSRVTGTEHGGLHFQVQVVLIVQFESSQHWPEGVAQLFVQICKKANSSFAQTAGGSLYWIAVIGIKEESSLISARAISTYSLAPHYS
jgi:hypothetical protein